MIISTNNPITSCTPRFGLQRRRSVAATTLAMVLGVVGSGCSQADKEPEVSSSATPDRPQGGPKAPGSAASPLNLQDTFTKSRSTLISELNTLSSPAEAQNIETDQVPNEDPPKHGTTSWQMGDHHYAVTWNFMIEGVQSIEATVENAEGQQFTITQNTHQAGEETILDRMTYTRPDGKNVDIVNPQDQNSADQLIDTMTLLSLAVSGSDYTPEEDWQQDPSPSDSPADSPTTEPSEPETASPSPTEPPSSKPPKDANNNNNRANLTVSSFNVARPHVNLPGHIEDLKALAHSGADIAGLQEAFGSEVRVALKEMPPNWKVYKATGKDAERTPIAWNSNVVKKIDAGRHLLLPRANFFHKGKGGDEAKWAVWVKFQYKGQIIRVVNVHMLAARTSYFPIRFNRYMNQVKAIAEFIRSIPEDEIVFLTGDMNSVGGHEDLKLIRKFMTPHSKAFKNRTATTDGGAPIDIVWSEKGSGVRFMFQKVFRRNSDHHQVNVGTSLPD